MPEPDPSGDGESVQKITSSSKHAGSSSPPQILDETSRREVQAVDATNGLLSGYKPQELLSASKTVTTTAVVGSRATGRRCVDSEPVDRPEGHRPSTSDGQMSDHAAKEKFETSRITRPSLGHKCVSEDTNSVLLDDETPSRPGVVASFGVHNHNMGASPRRTDTWVIGDGTEQQSPNPDPNGNRPKPPFSITADVALCDGAAPDVEQGGPLQAKPIDEVEYRLRIESEYRDRLLQQAAVDDSPNVVRAVAEKDSSSEGKLCSLSSRATWIAIILVVLVVIGLAVGVTVGLNPGTSPSTLSPTTVAPPATVAPNSTIEPVPVLSCEERCNSSSSWAKVEAEGPELKRAILLYLEGKVTWNETVKVIPY
jgi:hypothetical protein